jgi:hypothetical protein
MKRKFLSPAWPALVGLLAAFGASTACRLSTPTPTLEAVAVRVSTTMPTPAPAATSSPDPTPTPLPTDSAQPPLGSAQPSFGTPASTHTPLPASTPAGSAQPPRGSAQPSIGTPLPTPTDRPTATPVPPSPSAQPPLGTPQATATSKPAPSQPAPAGRTVRVGLDGRNDTVFQEADYQLVREAKIETLKMMSLTDPAVFARIQQENPGVEFIVRLYDDRMNANGHPTPKEFADRMIPVMRSLQPYAVKFEVGNEPNHFRRFEGWGPTDADAQNFNAWFLEVYGLLKAAHPWAELGYPALATPDSYHRDKAWLALTREAVERADWLGVHCYWQSPPDKPNTMFDEAHGLCFKYYHELFPDKPLEMTEFDNDNVVWDLPPLAADQIAQEAVTYYQELFKYPYIRSASAFIMSSPDARWDYFAWRTDSGGFKPAVAAVADMARPALVR